MKALTSAQGALCVALVLLLSVGVVHARVIYVANDGPADFSTIGDAVTAAQSGDTIVVLPGTYAGWQNRDLVLAGKSLTIRSSDPNDPKTVAATVIDCEAGDGRGHRFIELYPNTGTQLSLAGLTVVNASGAFSGGVVLCEAAHLQVTNCTFASNDVQWWGGAIHCVDSYANIEGCTFIDNTSKAMHGGAIYGKNSTVSIAYSAFRRNTGNAIQTFDSAVTLYACAFESNVGRDGGAVYCYAALELVVPAYLNVVNCTFSKNTTETSGGALHMHNMEAMITASVFTANTAGADGGAIFNYRSSPSVTSCIFTQNKAVDIGGAVANYNESAPEIINATFVGNEADSGGGVSSKRNSDPLISHSILWGNQAAQGSGLYIAWDSVGLGSASKATLEYSDIEGGRLAAYAEPGCTLTWGLGNINADPLFTGLDFDDYHLSPDSPCVDTGDPNYVPDRDATDLAGYPRRFGKTVDMGAYEYQGLGPVYRFWSPIKSRHFYTISGAERDGLIAHYPHAWQYEGIAYYAFYQNSETGLAPVYRFWSSVTGDHVWTTSEREKDYLLTGYPDEWIYEGIAFYAYAPGKPPLGTSPVYRFWSDKLAAHFYTMDEKERDKLIEEYPDVWTYEGIAYHAYPTPYQPKEITYDFIGGAEETWYTMILTAYIDGQEADIDAPEIRFTATSAWMQLTADFVNLTATLNGFHVQSQVIKHIATITQRGSKELSIPLELIAEASFESLFPRGPFVIDPATGTFADFTDAGQTLGAAEETYSYNGSIVLGELMTEFDRTTSAVALELESSGTFESLGLLPDNVNVSMPLTFQWYGPSTKELLVETYVDGHLVQVYVTHTYVGTQGLWEGQAVD